MSNYRAGDKFILLTEYEFYFRKSTLNACGRPIIPVITSMKEFDDLVTGDPDTGFLKVGVTMAFLRIFEETGTITPLSQGRNRLESEFLNYAITDLEVSKDNAALLKSCVDIQIDGIFLPCSNEQTGFFTYPSFFGIPLRAYKDIATEGIMKVFISGRQEFKRSHKYSPLQEYFVFVFTTGDSHTFDPTVVKPGAKPEWLINAVYQETETPSFIIGGSPERVQLSIDDPALLTSFIADTEKISDFDMQLFVDTFYNLVVFDIGANAGIGGLIANLSALKNATTFDLHTCSFTGYAGGLNSIFAYTFITCMDNQLTVANVNQILIDIDASNVAAGRIGTVDLSGQTPAAVPTGAGATAASDLTTAGWTVTTD